MHVNPAFRCGVKLDEKRRAMGDLKQSEANKASAIHTPVNLPTWGLRAQVCRRLRKVGALGRLGMEKVNRADSESRALGSLR